MTDPLTPPHDSFDPQRESDEPHRQVLGEGADVVASEPGGSFWGTQSDWAPVAQRDTPSTARPGFARWWSSVTAGRQRAGAAPARQRVHGGAAPMDDPGRPRDADEAPDSDDTAAWPDDWSPEDTPRTGVDPLIARLGGLAVVLTIMVSVLLGLGSERDDDLSARASAVAVVAPELNTTQAEQETTSDSSPATAAVTPAVDAAPTGADMSPSAGVEPTPAPSPDSTEMPEATPDAESLAAPSCGQDYEIVAGDFWIRIADGAGVDVAELLAVNDATRDTALYPGRAICLPEGASTPPPPPAATTSEAPAASPSPANTTAPNRTVPTSTTAPATKAPATTVAAPPPAPTASAAEVQAIVRAVWPDDLEERALEIAQRESKFQSTAKNSCCYGVFQIHWNAHQSWLGDLGIVSASQLYDPTLNTRAALMLYERAGGWGPWGG